MKYYIDKHGDKKPIRRFHRMDVAEFWDESVKRKKPRVVISASTGKKRGVMPRAVYYSWKAKLLAKKYLLGEFTEYEVKLLWKDNLQLAIEFDFALEEALGKLNGVGDRPDDFDPEDIDPEKEAEFLRKKIKQFHDYKRKMRKGKK